MVEELESHIVEKMLTGSSTAFALVVNRHIGSVSNFVRKMTWDGSDSEDIVQETFVRLWTTRSSFDPTRVKLTTWIHKIAHNLCIDSFRRQPHIYPELTAEPVNEGIEAGPEQIFEANARAKLVRHALLSLPERQRSAVVMCHYQGLSNKDAADILDITIDALESLLSRGRRRLKALLTEQFEHQENLIQRLIDNPIQTTHEDNL